jgi:Transposase DDE domain
MDKELPFDYACGNQTKAIERSSNMSLDELFCNIDDFCQEFLPKYYVELKANKLCKRQRSGELHPSEIMTILVMFHQSHYRDFKFFYSQHVQTHHQRDFPRLVSYQRFVQVMPSVLLALCAYLKHCFGRCTGISFVDSTPLRVCNNRRIRQHHVFKDVAQRGKTSMGWFYGFKLHVVCNDLGELLACSLTAGNVDDRVPVPDLAKALFGKLFGDKGYISKPLFKKLFDAFGIQLVTGIKSNMKNQLMVLSDKLLLRKRSIIETIYDQLKNISQIEHTRHRSLPNFLVNLISGLIAYCHQPKKPSLYLATQSLLIA